MASSGLTFTSSGNMGVGTIAMGNSSTVMRSGAFIVNKSDPPAFEWNEKIKDACDYCGFEKQAGIIIRFGSSHRIICNKCLANIFDKILGVDMLVGNRI